MEEDEAVRKSLRRNAEHEGDSDDDVEVLLFILYWLLMSRQLPLQRTTMKMMLLISAKHLMITISKVPYTFTSFFCKGI